jgi:hypothetical protein
MDKNGEQNNEELLTKNGKNEIRDAHSFYRLNAHRGRNAAVERAKALFLLNGPEAGNDRAEAAACMSQLRTGLDDV